MPKITQQEATLKAESFIAARRDDHLCGALQKVTHKPPNEKTKRYTGRESGSYYVEFAYAGPPVRQHSLPHRDHPTVVIVDDESGECSVMKWL